MFEIYSRLMGTPARKELRGIPKICIQNVDDYMYSLNKSEYDVVDDFPNCAPIFPRMWFEWRSNLLTDDTGGGTWFGCSWFSEEFPDRIENGFTIKADPRWITTAAFYYSMGNFSGFAPYGTYINIKVKRDGRLDNENTRFMFAPGLSEHLAGEGYDPTDFIIRKTASTAGVVLMALSLAHCKNVEIVERQIPVNRKKKKKKPGYKYYVLEIEPMRKVLKYEGDIENVGLKKALHICRGHFKDYRDGPGLFGRYQDIYWWSQHVRGDPSTGVVEKDYAIGKVKG